MPVPNFENLPLVNLPYNGRTATTNGEYQMVAFRPGYPLQASELNEIQEQFYVQQALTTMMWANWCTFKVASQQDSTGPGWAGATPLQPDLLSLSNDLMTVKKGWYLCKMYSSGLYFWLYNNVANSTFALSSAQINQYVGFTITTQGTITATTSPVFSGGFVDCNDDPGLKDNAGGSVGSCGADRYKVEITAVGISNTGHSASFVPIVQRREDGFYFLNNTKVGDI